MLLTRQKMRLPVNLLFDRPTNELKQSTVELSDYMANLEEKLRTMHNLVRDKLN